MSAHLTSKLVSDMIETSMMKARMAPGEERQGIVCSVFENDRVDASEYLLLRGLIDTFSKAHWEPKLNRKSVPSPQATLPRNDLFESQCFSLVL